MIAWVCGDTLIWKPSEKTPLSAMACQSLVAKVAAEEMPEIPAAVSSLMIGNGAEVGQALAGTFGDRQLEGQALDHAQSVVAAAIRTLERLRDIGWRSVLGEGPGGGQRPRIGRCCPRSESGCRENMPGAPSSKVDPLAALAKP